MLNLEFIDESNPTKGHDRVSAYKVRRQAMRHYRRQQKSASGHDLQVQFESQNQEGESSGTHSGGRKLPPWRLVLHPPKDGEDSGSTGEQAGDNTVLRKTGAGIRSWASMVEPKTILGEGFRDPFSSMVTKSNARIDYYVHYFLTTCGPVSTPIDKVYNNCMTLYFPAARADELVFHSIMTMASTHRAMLQQKQQSSIRSFFPESLGNKEFSWERDALTHRLRSIQLINERLNDPVTGISDAVIIAILLLIGCEAVIFEGGQSEIHIRGLRDIIKLRGGMQNIPQQLRAQVLTITMHEAISCSGSILAPPHLTHPDISTVSQPPFYLSSTNLTILHPPLSTFLHPTLIRAFTDLADVTSFARHLATTPTYPGDPPAAFRKRQVRYYDDVYVACEASLLSLPHGEEDRSSENIAMCGGAPWSAYVATSPLQEATRLALLLYANQTVWNFEPMSTLLQRLVGFLVPVIGEISASITDPMDLTYLQVWVLLTGTHAASPTARTRFINRLRYLLDEVYIDRDWDIIEDIMCGFLYNKEMHAVAWKAIWQEALGIVRK